jgi:hypothetical protein
MINLNEESRLFFSCSSSSPGCLAECLSNRQPLLQVYIRHVTWYPILRTVGTNEIYTTTTTNCCSISACPAYCVLKVGFNRTMVAARKLYYLWIITLTFERLIMKKQIELPHVIKIRRLISFFSLLKQGG